MCIDVYIDIINWQIMETFYSYSKNIQLWLKALVDQCFISVASFAQEADKKSRLQKGGQKARKDKPVQSMAVFIPDLRNIKTTSGWIVSLLLRKNSKTKLFEWAKYVFVSLLLRTGW